MRKRCESILFEFVNMGGIRVPGLRKRALMICSQLVNMLRVIKSRETYPASQGRHDRVQDGRKSPKVQGQANIYITDIWRQYGLPKAITSDRGPQFASAFLRLLNKALDICLRTSAAYHPQTDGLTERAIQSLKQYLRIYCHDRQNMWVRWLPLAEFAYNTSPHSVTKKSSIFAMYGFEPQGI